MRHSQHQRNSLERQPRPSQRLSACFTVAVLLCAAHARANSPELEFLSGLVDRGLYRLAEIQGYQLLDRDNLDDREQVELALQMADMYMRQAMELPRDQRDTAWNNVDAVLDQFIEQYPQSPQLVLLEIQRALARMTRVDLERLETTGTRLELQGLTVAREQLRDAIARLTKSVEQIEQELANRRGRSSDESGLTTDELFNLRRQLDLQLGRAYHQQALCYSPESADGDNAFLLALEHLSRLVDQSTDDPLTWEARLETLRAQRELGHHDQAQALWIQWQQESLPPKLVAAFAAELVRLQLARGDVSGALETATQFQGDAGPLQLALLEALVAQWELANKDAPEAADDCVNRITSQLEAIRRDGDPQDVRQAERLVGRAMSSSPADQPADALALAAETLYHAGNWQEAIATYDRAAAQLRESGDRDRAFDIGLTAAAIEREAGDFSAVSERYRELGSSNPQHDRAADAHLLAIVCRAEALRIATPDDVDMALAEYRALLAEHLELWPSSETGDDVRWWSAKLAIESHRWTDALTFLQAIPAASDYQELALLAAADCYEALVASSDASAIQLQELVGGARRFLQPAITGADNRWPNPWSDRQLRLAVSLARLHVAPGVDDLEYAERLLRAAWSGLSTAEEDRELHDMIRAQLVDVLVRRGKYQAAAELYVGQGSTDMLSTIEQLAAQAPQNGDLQEIHAALLAEGESSQQLEKSLERWSQIEHHSQRGGTRWFRARRARVVLLRRLGREVEAEKLERLTRLLYPQE